MSQAGRLYGGMGPIMPNIMTLTGNIGPAVGPDGAGNINTIGANVISSTGNAGTNTVTFSLLNGTNGQVLIGGGAAPAWANITSTGGTITITNGPNTINLEATAPGTTLTFTTDAGDATPAANEIEIVGGTNINTSGAGNTVTVNLDTNVNIPGTLTVDTLQGVVQATAGLLFANTGTDGQVLIGSSTGPQAWANITAGAGIAIANGHNTITISATGATNPVTEITTDAGGPVTPAAGEIEIVGGANINTTGTVGPNTVTIALDTNVDIPGTLTVDTLTGVVQANAGLFFANRGTNGQILIGATGGPQAWANITSADGTVVITNMPNVIDLSVSTTTIRAITTDTGGPVTPLSGEIEILGGANINTVGTVGPNTVTINLNDNVIIPGSLTVNTLSPGVVQTGGFALFSNKGTNGQVLISSTAGVPAWANLTAGAGIAIANGPNTITISNTGGGAGQDSFFVWLQSTSSFGQAEAATLPAINSVGGTFNYYLIGTNANTGVGRGMWTILYDNSGGIAGGNAAPLTFTAPANGYYYINMNLGLSLTGAIMNGIMTPRLMFNTAGQGNVVSTWSAGAVSGTFFLQAGDVVNFVAASTNNSSQSITLNSYYTGATYTGNGMQAFITGYRVA